MQDKEELTSQLKVEAKLKNEGYTEDFRVTEDNRLCSYSGDKSYSVDEVRIVDFYRFEGETNPDDMAILYAIECNDGTKGKISNSYGPYADQNIDAFLKEVEDLGKNIDESGV
ncbi:MULTISPECIES: hypothetical protein [Rufibacter]|uniref:Phosphoribosylpyrophosphate synthetase n=1 Tax=Rufibacter quisquiliarum TaxID=1549639 RepID=A0A839GAD1_9BACT|nr:MULTISPECIES: hypothetical protein [Rufibacter]MBA9075882.1 hypothetical protein [Rufibacter quisquiliarum]